MHPKLCPPLSCQGLWGSMVRLLDFWTPLHFLESIDEPTVTGSPQTSRLFRI